MNQMRFLGVVFILSGMLLGPLSGVVLLMNVQAQVPTKAKIAFVSKRDGNEEIYVMDADGKNVHRLTNNPWRDYDPAWSPGGQRIVFDADGNNPGIYMMDADGKNPRQLTHDADRLPVWSPDGRKIAFQSSFFRDRNTEIYVMDADGKNLRNLTNNPAAETEPA